MTNGNDRLDRIEAILQEMAARQQYHDEAFERFDSEMKEIRETITDINQAIALDAENIRALARIAELHQQRIDRIEGDEPA
jgi:prefoldin subunit 5